MRKADIPPVAIVFGVGIVVGVAISGRAPDRLNGIGLSRDVVALGNLPSAEIHLFRPSSGPSSHGGVSPRLQMENGNL
jgi:hypothetical protein